ncbi:unnamed protein product, partial [Callosobruchus maculatus]
RISCSEQQCCVERQVSVAPNNQPNRLSTSRGVSANRIIVHQNLILRAEKNVPVQLLFSFPDKCRQHFGTFQANSGLTVAFFKMFSPLLQWTEWCIHNNCTRDYKRAFQGIFQNQQSYMEPLDPPRRMGKDNWRLANYVVDSPVKTKWAIPLAIHSFEPYKSSGPYGIYPVLLQKASQVFACRLCA